MRPRIRAECIHGPRPCPWVSCRYHLAIRHIYENGRIDVVPDWDDGRPTCALDVAEEDGKSLQEIGDILGVNRQAIDQMIKRTLRVLRRRFLTAGVTLDDLGVIDLEEARDCRERQKIESRAPGEYGAVPMLRKMRRVCKDRGWPDEDWRAYKGRG